MSALAAARGMRMRVVPASRVDSEEWDVWVRRRPEATFCHASAWAAVMADALGHESCSRVALDGDGRIAGILPLVRVRSRLFGHYLVSMPFLNYGGALGNAEAVGALEADALDEARRSRVDVLELRYPWHMQDSPANPASGELETTARKVAVLLDLPDTADTLWNEGFRSKLRSQIRRPMKEGMTVSTGAAELEAFHDVFGRNMRDLGTPVLPRRFFERVLASLPESVEFAVVRHRGRPVAAACGFFWGVEFEITWASSLREFNHLSPNMLLYWSLMEHAIERGARRFNFGRCSPDGPTHRFKMQWGGTETVLPWRAWSAAGAPATPSADSPKYRLATGVWQRLPLAVTNRLGPVLARVIP